MQWKGPFHIDSVVSVNNYRVKIKGKCKTYHCNLFKKYVARDEADNKEETDVSGFVLEVTGAAIIEFSESTSDDAVDDDNLLEIGVCQSKESIADVHEIQTTAHS